MMTVMGLRGSLWSLKLTGDQYPGSTHLKDLRVVSFIAEYVLLEFLTLIGQMVSINFLEQKP